MNEILNLIGDVTKCPTAIIIKDDKVLMGHRHYTPDKWKTISVWTCPGGRCDEGETIETTLRREVEEETGITQLEIEEYLGEVPGAQDGDFVPLFLCSTEQDAELIEPHKFSEWAWFSKDEIPDSYINQDALKIVYDLLK